MFPEAAAVGRFRVGQATLARRRRARSPAPATPASGASRSPCRRPPPRPCGTAIIGAGIQPAGLGARDTLRLEAALPLHGHELGPGITPLQAGLGWVVAWDKPEFRGRDALVAERERGRRAATSSASPPRAGGRHGPSARSSSTVTVVGEVTSGNFSPVLGHGIALAFVPPTVGEGTAVEIDVRGTRLPGTVVATPFVRR